MRGKADAQLAEWGVWYVRCNEGSSGSQNMLFRIMVQGIAGAGPAGHRILCADMPRRVLQTHRAVLAQSSGDQLVLRAKYCAPLRDDGTAYEHRELAGILGITREAFKSRLRRARGRVSRHLGLT